MVSVPIKPEVTVVSEKQPTVCRGTALDSLEADSDRGSSSSLPGLSFLSYKVKELDNVKLPLWSYFIIDLVTHSPTQQASFLFLP